MDDFSTILIFTGVIVVMSLLTSRIKELKKMTEEKNNADIDFLSSSKDSWKKVGKVKEILFYPLKSGRANSVKKCKFGERGIMFEEKGKFCMRDRMFLVYDVETGRFQTGRQFPKLLLVRLCAVGENRAKLQAEDMPILEFDLPDATDKNVKSSNCTMWWNEPVNCVDCGEEASAWISKFLLLRKNNLRLGLCPPDQKRKVTIGSVWHKHAKVYKKLRDEDAGLFSDLASYMLISEASVLDLNERLLNRNGIKPSQLRPNVIIEGCNPYDEDNWEWMRIGKDAILRNFKPCTRCKMILIDPDTGIPDAQSEPMKTLKKYRKLHSPEKNSLENYAPAIGVYCGSYRTGQVQIGDDIHVYIGEDKLNSMNQK